jgi:hypothetical protein
LWKPNYCPLRFRLDFPKAPSIPMSVATMRLYSER